MKTARFTADRLERLFHQSRVATLPQLKAALGTHVDGTVFRKLSSLPYRTSYSHRGAYYTLDTIARYDELGLWSYHDIHFSQHGTLLNTAATLVAKSPAGYFTDELEAVVRVGTKDALRQLAVRGQVDRRELGGAVIGMGRQNGGGANNSGLPGRRSKRRRMSSGRPLCSSTACSTNNSAASTQGWKAWNGAMVATSGWLSCSGWMWTRWRVGAANY